MDGQIKSKEQLIKELEDLQQKYDSLKAISDADITRLELAEGKLSKLEHRNRALLENSPVCTQIIDLDFNLQYMSDAGIKGLQIDDITSYCGKPYPFHFYPESFKTEMMRNMLGAIETGKLITLEAPVVDVNGHELWYRSTIVPVKDATDRVDYLMIVSLDITEQKIAERTNSQSEKKYRQLFETLSEGVALNEIIYNDQGEMVDYRILEVNNAFYTTARYDGPVLGRLATDLYKLPVGFITSFWWEHKDRHTAKYTEMISPVNGRNILVATSPFIDDRFVTSFFDITEHKQGEEALQNSMQLLEKTMSSLLDAVFIIDADTVKIVDCNPAASTIFGYSRQEMLGQTTAFLHVDETSLEGFRLQLYSDMKMAKEFMFLPEYKMKHKDGTVFFSEHSVVPLKNKHGQRIGWVSVVRDITERKLSEAIFKDIVEKNPISIQILDLDGYPIQVNSAHTNLFGVKPPADYSVFKDHQLLSLGFDEFFGRIKKGEVVYLPDTFYNVHDVDPSFPDSPVWVKAVGFTLNDNNGKPEKIVLMHENITERKNAEALLNDIIENNPMSIQIVDKKGYTLRGNPAFNQLFGALPPPEFSIFEDLKRKNPELGNLITQVKDGAIVKLPDTHFNAHDNVEEAPDIPLWIRALIFPLKNNSGKPERFVFMHENITESKNAEQELIAQRQIYEQILEQSLAGYWDWDITTGYEYLSPTFKKMFGYEDDEIENRAESWQKLIFSEDLPAVYEEFNKHTESKGKIPYYNEVRYHHKNGSIIWVICTGKVIEWDDNGKPMRMIGCHIDITARKQIEQELNRAKEKAQESDRLKSAFLANMSHEIRTPMNGILGFAEILKDPELTGDQQQEYIKIIEKSGNRMLNIINDIVDISKIESGLMKVNLSESNINEQIEYIYTFFKLEVEAKGMKLLFHTTLSAQEATILTDREKVYAILTNLVKNAIKYSREGSIEIGYTCVETQCIASLQFYVKDTGIGIPLDRQEAIFERFIQADITDKMARQGAGLGLAITKSHVEMLGGKIWVESKEGEGSTFYFTLPYTKKTEVGTFVQSSISGIEKYNWPKKLKILIAEDDPTSEMLISLIVNTFGREILKVQTGIAAIETCRQNPDIDLILMDIQMPHMGGYEATRRIREFNKSVVIIAQTAYGLSGDREKAIEAGCNDYIAKPIKKDELLLLIQKYFGK